MLANTNLKIMLTGTHMLSGARLQACSVRPVANAVRPARANVVANAKRRSKRAKDVKGNPSAQVADIEKPGAFGDTPTCKAFSLDGDAFGSHPAMSGQYLLCSMQHRRNPCQDTAHTP